MCKTRLLGRSQPQMYPIFGDNGNTNILVMVKIEGYIQIYIINSDTL